MKPKYKNPLYTRLWRRVHRNRKNALIIICGETGSGKSTLGLKLCRVLDPTFDERRVISRPKEFLDIVVNGKLKNGQAIMVDEAGTVANAREWYTFNNKAISYILQTFTYQRLICVFTVPSFDYVDKQSRYLFHYYIEPRKIDFRKKTTIAKVQRLQYNALTGKLYRKYERFMIDGEYCKVVLFHFKKPNQALCDAYDKKSHEFKKEVAQNMYDTIKKIEAKMSVTQIDIYKTAIDIVETFDEDVLKERSGRMFAHLNMLKAKYGLTPQQATDLKAIIDMILEKGFWEDEKRGKVKVDMTKKKKEEELREPAKAKVMFNVCERCGLSVSKGFESMATFTEKCKNGHAWKY